MIRTLLHLMVLMPLTAITFYYVGKNVEADRLLAAKIPIVQDDAVQISYAPNIVANGCFVAAVGYKDVVEAKMQLGSNNHWVKLMHVDSVSMTVTGHAICVFHYNGIWRVYDPAKGTYTLGTYKNDPTPQDIASSINSNYRNARWID